VTVRIVQVGMGVRGAQWAQVVRAHPAAEVVGFVRPELEIARRQVVEWGEVDTPCFDDLGQALKALHPDAVLLATPPGVHCEETLLSFSHGCHVLCEKPLSEDFSETVEMVGAAEESDRLLMAGMNFRYLATSQRLRQIFARSELGTPGFGHFVYIRNRDGRRPDLNKYPLVMDHPMLLEQSIHHLDLMRYCYNDEVVSVNADTWRPEWSVYTGDCCVSALLHFRSGLRVNYLGTWTSGWNRFSFEWRTDCSGGVVFQKEQFDDLVISHLTPGLALQGELFKTGSEVEPLERIPLPPCRAFLDDSRGLLDEFVEAVENSKPLLTSGRDHLKTLGLTHACIEAAETGQRIQMQEFYPRQGIPERWL